jgi:hypothetical protein
VVQALATHGAFAFQRRCAALICRKRTAIARSAAPAPPPLVQRTAAFIFFRRHRAAAWNAYQRKNGRRAARARTRRMRHRLKDLL